MKKILIVILIVAVTFGLLYAGFRYDFNTSDRIKMVDSDGNTMYFVDDDGTTGDLHIADITVDDDLTVTDALTVSGVASFGAINITGAMDISADFTVDGGFIIEPTAVVILDTSTALGTLDAFVLVIGSNTSGAFVMVSDATPFISTITAITGQLITIMGTDATGTVQLSDNGTVTGSLLELDGTTIVLGLGSNITLRYYSGKWYQTGGINTID